MKSKEEIEQLAEQKYLNQMKSINDSSIKGYVISARAFGFVEGYTQCQEDMVKGIQSLIDFYKSDILLLEKEFRDSSSVLTLEKIVTLQGVITDLEKII